MRVNRRNNGLMLRPSMTRAERYSEYARAIDCEANKYRYRSTRRRERIPSDMALDPAVLAKWQRQQSAADRAFVTTIVRLVEAFDA